MRDGRKGSRYTGWEIVHIRWSSIFEKWIGTNAKLEFGGCFTKHPNFGTLKMEIGYFMHRKGKLPPATS
jgi:hypothetical protein